MHTKCLRGAAKLNRRVELTRSEQPERSLAMSNRRSSESGELAFLPLIACCMASKSNERSQSKL